ncbi:hypothetical protein MBOT_07130 [Mycobacterium botniense]|uniref:Uncharacterized protein n=1 Tax=Mycobacterium botniense TaxID=84962 RepID=A0A7I9XU60_9MYCO|nr:hypothetical protein MBOT_07130 [Mycobacterium botniense]
MLVVGAAAAAFWELTAEPIALKLPAAVDNASGWVVTNIMFNSILWVLLTTACGAAEEYLDSRCDLRLKLRTLGPSVNRSGVFEVPISGKGWGCRVVGQQEHNPVHAVGRAAVRWDNSCHESFWATVKVEFDDTYICRGLKPPPNPLRANGSSEAITETGVTRPSL